MLSRLSCEIVAGGHVSQERPFLRDSSGLESVIAGGAEAEGGGTDKL